MTAVPVGVGIIGAGVISKQYLENLTKFADVEVLFIADLDTDRARSQADAWQVPGHGTVEQLLEIEQIEIVVNLTIPAAHPEVGRRILAAGKHVWSEKPLALDLESAADLLATAREYGLRVACAPDTVLGAGIQTAMRAIARGDIGDPLTAITIFQVAGPESWHPNPDFYYAAGGGPLLDMGPYYVTTLVHAFGPVREVSAVSSTMNAHRTVRTGPRAGTVIPVEIPTHYSALLRFDDGRSAQATFSFQNALQRQGFFEVSGSEGTLVVPDPNNFDGASTFWKFGHDEPITIPASGSTYGRGSGVVDLARALRRGGRERCSGDVALHVLDVLLSVARAAETGQTQTVGSTVDRPVPLEEDWDPAAPTL